LQKSAEDRFDGMPKRQPIEKDIVFYSKVGFVL